MSRVRLSTPGHWPSRTRRGHGYWCAARTAGKQVIVVSGDGGLGIGGMDMETAAKYNIPIITLLWNNSSWGPTFESMPLLKGRTDPFDMIKDIRYDKVFEPMGVYTEHVSSRMRLFRLWSVPSPPVRLR